jgi:predicted nucleic acid-binding protein
LDAAFPSDSRGAAFRSALQRLLGRVRLWPLERETARFYGTIYQELRERGRVLSQVDMMLAALARQMNVTVATADRDFEALPDIRTESWLHPAGEIP